jgi:glycosyltransferase involved in cell wall biosynthesis
MDEKTEAGLSRKSVPPPRLLIVTGNYPSALHPACGAFVRSFVHALVDAGAEAGVVHPISIPSRLRGPYPQGGIDKTPGKRAIPLHRPLYASFSVRDLGFMNTAVLTQAGFEHSVLRTIRRLAPLPTIAYGHFLYSAGRAAVRAGAKLGIPSFVAVGEGTFWSVEPIGFERGKRDFTGVTGMLAVSSVLKEKLIAELDIPAGKIGVFPNGADLQKFYPRNRAQMRAKYGIPDKGLVVAYVGNFLKEKGVGVLAAALDGLEGTGALFIGSGPLQPQASNIIFRGVLPHEHIPEILSAADLFVMPSFVEGSCNAVIEAMACGLPVIASSGKFHDDILDGTMSVRVDTTQASAIREAVILLRDDPDRRASMARSALERSKIFDIHIRAERVLRWMAEKISHAQEEPGAAV